MRIYFVTTNRFKINELRGFLKEAQAERRHGVELCPLHKEIQEILHPDIEVMVRQKVLEAYRDLGQPCVVEHGGLFLDALPGLPGGVGQIVWQAVGDRMCDFLRSTDSRGVVARSLVGYCDGQCIRTYLGETRGRITKQARGKYSFHWDTIFVPQGSTKTYGEMGPIKKRATSPTMKAWNSFLMTEFPVTDSVTND